MIRKKGRIGRLNKKGMLILAVFSIYVGLSEQGVDNAAHIGGLACGFVLEALLGSVKRRASKTQSNETWND